MTPKLGVGYNAKDPKYVAQSVISISNTVFNVFRCIVKTVQFSAYCSSVVFQINMSKM